MPFAVSAIRYEFTLSFETQNVPETPGVPIEKLPKNLQGTVGVNSCIEIVS
jgi:hypothetical protein